MQMIDPMEYIESGLLELYVLGQTTAEETEQVEQLAGQFPQIQQELDAIAQALENYATQHAIAPHETIGPMLLATVDFMNRLQGGEVPSNPPLLNEHSTAADFSEWINRSDFQPDFDYENIFVKLIGSTPVATTGIVWIKQLAPDEVHHDEHERFLVLEGTCEITIGEKVHALKPGDFLAIPLHEDHLVKVTSEQPCKVILQRVAA